ncbi:MAG: hypothetical protein M0R68_01405 [Bacteroidetes bacterium]|nr:hypothetical protein [Bacteroidota bacterium]
MNTKILLSSSATFMGLAGIVCSFFPQEISLYLNANSSGMAIIVIQLTGALYFSFAMMNWTAKENLLGGIYGRPITIGNMTHFVIGALALLKVVSTTNPSPLLLSATFVYTVYAILFGMIFFRHPKQTQQ